MKVIGSKPLSILLIIFFLIAPVVIFAQTDMPLDSSLKNNSQFWKVKMKQKFSARYKPASVSFGPVKTVETSAEKAKLVSRENGKGILWKTRKTKSSREYNIVITCDEKDTIIIYVLRVTTDENENITTVGEMVSINKITEGQSSSSSWTDEMAIQFQSDTTVWHFERTGEASANNQDTIRNLGILWYGVDTFIVKQADNFSGQKLKKILFGQPAGGLVIYEKDEQVAALQYLMKNAVWLRSDIDARKRKVLLAAITGFLSTSNNTPQ